MQSAASQCPDDPVELRAEVLRLQEDLARAQRQREEHEQHIQRLLDYITLLKRKRFGPSADRIPAEQLKLFDEAELEALIAELEEQAQPPAPSTPDKPAPEKPKDKPVRRPLPEHLPRVQRILDLPEAEKQAMGSGWTFIGFEESEQLAVIPRQPYVIVFKRAKYVPLDEHAPRGRARGGDRPAGAADPTQGHRPQLIAR